MYINIQIKFKFIFLKSINILMFFLFINTKFIFCQNYKKIHIEVETSNIKLKNIEIAFLNYNLPSKFTKYVKPINFQFKNNKFRFEYEVDTNTPYFFNFVDNENKFVISNMVFLSSTNNYLSLSLEKNKIKVKSKNQNQLHLNQLIEKYSFLYKNDFPILDSLNDFKIKYKILNEFIYKKEYQLPIFWIIVDDFLKSVKSEELILIYDNNLNKLYEQLNNFNYFKILKKLIETEKSLFVSKKFPTQNYTFKFQLDSIIKSSRYTVIDYWGTWCKPCIENLPILKKLYTQYKNNGLDFLSISIRSNEQAVGEKINKFKIKWKNFNDTKGETDKLNIQMFPCYFILGTKGEIIYRSNDGIIGVEKKINELFKIKNKK